MNETEETPPRIYRRVLASIPWRILRGTRPVIAIKECCDDWNRYNDRKWYLEEPEWLDQERWLWINAWVAGAAELSAYYLQDATPEWALEPRRFLKKPFAGEYLSFTNTRKLNLVETPFPFRRRLIFAGATIQRPVGMTLAEQTRRERKFWKRSPR